MIVDYDHYGVDQLRLNLASRLGCKRLEVSRRDVWGAAGQVEAIKLGLAEKPEQRSGLVQ